MIVSGSTEVQGLVSMLSVSDCLLRRSFIKVPLELTIFCIIFSKKSQNPN